MVDFYCKCIYGFYGYIPDDSKWPFYPLYYRSLNRPKKVTKNGQVQIVCHPFKKHRKAQAKLTKLLGMLMMMFVKIVCLFCWEHVNVFHCSRKNPPSFPPDDSKWSKIDRLESHRLTERMPSRALWHLEKRKIIFKRALVGDMLVPSRVLIQSHHPWLEYDWFVWNTPSLS